MTATSAMLKVRRLLASRKATQLAMMSDSDNGPFSVDSGNKPGAQNEGTPCPDRSVSLGSRPLPRASPVEFNQGHLRK